MNNRNSIVSHLVRVGVTPLTVSCRCSPYSFLGTRRFRLGQSVRNCGGAATSSLLGVRAKLFNCGKQMRFRANTYVGSRLTGVSHSLPGPRLFTHVSTLVSGHVRTDCQVCPGGCITRSLLRKGRSFSSRCATRSGRHFATCVRRRLRHVSVPGGSISFLHKGVLLVCTGPLGGCLTTVGR